MKIHHLLAILALTAGAALSTQAATPRADVRQAAQEKRIDQGEASGQLTSKEAKGLEKGEAMIDKAEDKAKADGTVTAKERVRLEKMEDRESKAIYRQKHDAQRDLNHDGKRDRKHRKPAN